MDAPNLKAGLTPLFLAVPPMFERSVGYGGLSRFVAFYWGTCDELCFLDDSLASGTIDAAGWLILMNHPFARLHFLPFQFGSAEAPARHMLLLDRKERRFHAGERRTVEFFLEECAVPDGRGGGAPANNGTMTLDDLISLSGNMERLFDRELSPDETMRRLKERQAVCAELREWLGSLG